MIYSSCLTEEDSLLVLDASVVINLLATGHAPAILAALNVPILLPEPVVREVENGERRGHGARMRCRDLLVQGHITIAELDGASLPVFMDLVAGTTSSSLGDGEAATIALASTRPGCAVIDEKKATKQLAARFGKVRVATTIDVLCHRAVGEGLGRESLVAATMAALNEARMQVREHQFDWVIEVVGAETAGSCSGLNRWMSAAQRRTS